MASELFRFTVGPQRREFTIHSALVARQSRALDTLVNGGFAEARNKHAVLESVDEETFALFTQYAYSGKYDVLSAGAWPETGPPEIKTTDGEDALFEPYDDDTSTPRARGRLEVLWARFTATANRFEKSGFYRDQEGDDVKSQSDIFCRHANMYIFADYYGISDLMDLAFNNLGERLIAFKLSDETVADILDLLRYCDDAAVPEELKSFVFLYAASQADALCRIPDFRECVLESRELTTALFTQVLEVNESDDDDDDDNYSSDSGMDTDCWNDYVREVVLAQDDERSGRYYSGDDEHHFYDQHVDNDGNDDDYHSNDEHVDEHAEEDADDDGDADDYYSNDDHVDDDGNVIWFWW